MIAILGQSVQRKQRMVSSYTIGPEPQLVPGCCSCTTERCRGGYAQSEGVVLHWCLLIHIQSAEVDHQWQ